MRLYLKQNGMDALLCAAVTLSLVPTVCSGFVLWDPWSRSTAAVALCSAVLTLVLLLLSYRRLTAWLGACACAVLLLGLFAWLRLAGPPEGEAENSAFIFALVQGTCALLVWLLGRSRPGCVVLFLAGCLVCAGARFLQFPAPGWCFFLFLPAAVLLYLQRVRAVAGRRAELGGVPGPGYFGQTLLLCALGFALALAVFFAVVAPLDPPTQELKLIRELKSMELLQVLGVSSTETVLDPELSADQPPEDREAGGQEGQEEPRLPQGTEETPPPRESGEPSLGMQFTGALQEAADAIRYADFSLSRLWLLLLIPLALVLACLARLWGKKRWRRRVRALPREDAVVNYYRFFLSRLGRAGLKRRPDCTLREFAGSAGTQLEPFEAASGLSFLRLTAVYESVVYGRHRVSDEEFARFERFYDGFYPALRRVLGPVRYYLKVFLY